ncbi:unnamed protein product [Lactuca saligna]|uniref:Uncharacterized protein n=1 Tax=Lactuca saligna TaxID=75948 RepID=A0AA36EFC4_LACSI|nr:unnamed protein product [Lactuca saligna]
MALYDLWIWHAFVGPSGANNNINVLDKSPILKNIYVRKSYNVSFQANEYEQKLICRYNENENLPNVEGVGIRLKTYMANKAEVYNRVGRPNLYVDLVQNIFNARTNPVVDDFVKHDLFDDKDDDSSLKEIRMKILMTCRTTMI